MSGRPYELEELEILKDLSLTHEQCAEKLQRTNQAILLKRKELGFTQPYRKRFTLEQLEILTNKEMTRQQKAEKLGISPLSVTYRSYLHRRRENKKQQKTEK